MMMGTTMDSERHRLLSAWRQLGDEERRSLVLFAEFLAQRQVAVADPDLPEEPLMLPKPPDESAVAALKRLKKSYPMIEADERLLGEAANVLMGKVLGTPDGEVIAALEGLFEERYRKWKATRGG